MGAVRDIKDTRDKLDRGLDEISELAYDSKIKFDTALQVHATAAERISDTVDVFLEGVTFVMAALAMVGVIYLGINIVKELTNG